MTNIVPISDLRNYSEVLSHCDDGSPVYLTKNGRGKYTLNYRSLHPTTNPLIFHLKIPHKTAI